MAAARAVWPTLRNHPDWQSVRDLLAMLKG
jgi:hypothetical protein